MTNPVANVEVAKPNYFKLPESFLNPQKVEFEKRQAESRAEIDASIAKATKMR